MTVGDSEPRAAGVGCGRGIAGSVEVPWRPGITCKRRPRRTIFGGAIKAQQSCATFRDRHARVEGRVRGAMGKEKGRLKILSSATTCTRRFLGELPPPTRLIVLFGLGSRMNYVDAALDLFRHARPGKWRMFNQVAYTDGSVVVVHVEHFAAQGALVPDWLGATDKPRQQLGVLAKQAVDYALNTQH